MKGLDSTANFPAVKVCFPVRRVQFVNVFRGPEASGKLIAASSDILFSAKKDEGVRSKRGFVEI